MYKKTTNLGTGFDINESTEGERIEEKVERLVNNKEPIRDTSPIIYTEKKTEYCQHIILELIDGKLLLKQWIKYIKVDWQKRMELSK